MMRTANSWVTYKGLRSGTLNLAGNVVVAITSVAPAYSLAAAVAAIVALAGPKTPALFVIGCVPMVLTAFAFRELASEAPDCGSTFTWTTRAFGPWVGWMAGWALIIASTVGVGNSAQVAAIYLLEALHLDSLAHSMTMQIVVGGVVVVVLVVLCLRGIDGTQRSQAVLLTVELAVLMLVSIVALVKVFTHHAGPQAVMPEWGWLSPAGLPASSIASGSVLCVFAFWGWDASLSVSEEAKGPRRNPGRAAVWATFLILGIYVLVSVAMQAFAGFGTTGIGLRNPANANNTLSVLGGSVIGGLALLLLLAIGSSSLGAVLTYLAPTARTMLAMGVYRALPRRFALVHRVYQTPWLGTIVIGVSGFAIYVTMTLLSRNSLPDMVSSLALVTTFYYAVTAYACVWTYRRTLRRSVRDFWLRGALPLLGALAMTWAFGQTAVNSYSPGDGHTHFGPVGGVFIMGIGLLVLGIPLAALSTIRERAFFRGKTLTAQTAITVVDEAAPAARRAAGDPGAGAGHGGLPGWPRRAYHG